MNVKIISDPTEQLMQQHNHKILQHKTKYDIITFDELDQTYRKEAYEEIDSWLPRYICDLDEIDLFKFSDEGVFERHIHDSIWSTKESTKILDRLKFLQRSWTYKEITKALGENWKDKTIIDFGAGKCIHSWLLADLFKQVVSVDILSVDLLIGLTIHQRLGCRDNINFYLGDITTCYDEVIETHKPDFLLFQLGYGFHHLKDYIDAPSKGYNLAKSISDKHQIPFFYK